MPNIKSVTPGSPAARAGVRPGEELIAINGNPVRDVLDYQYHGYDAALVLTLRGQTGETRTVALRKDDGDDMGLTFESYLMDTPRSCANHCVFCFVDQLPAGLRDTLYFKDDDARLSFLTGTYITLTNLTEREAQRIIDLRISPINISVHATDPAVRALLLGHQNAGRGLDLLYRFAAAGITLNCQVVACPGLNDGAVLQKTLDDLAALYPAVNSLSVVPVGLTRHRKGLYPLSPYTKEQAQAVVDLVERAAARCLERVGTRIFWCSDEFYLCAGRPLPEDAEYEEYTQLENGVGMLTLLKAEFVSRLSQPGPSDCYEMEPRSAPDGGIVRKGGGEPPLSRSINRNCDEITISADCYGTPKEFRNSLPSPLTQSRRQSIATGVAAAPFLRELVDMARARCNTIHCKVYAIVNDFFGPTVDVAGLVTGGDLIAQLKGEDLGSRLLIPAAMLRHGEGVFLDDVTVAEAEAALGVPIVPIPQDGYALCEALFD